MLVGGLLSAVVSIVTETKTWVRPRHYRSGKPWS